MLGVGQHLHGEGGEKPARGVTKQYICVQCQISGWGVWWGFILVYFTGPTEWMHDFTITKKV